MAIDAETFSRAKALKTDAVAALLSEFYPLVHRVAHGLTGREETGRAVTQQVLVRAVKVLPTWQRSDQASRWFLHHTVLTSRRAPGEGPRPDEDLLVTRANHPAPEYIAFVRAVRHLPFQQGEAFILNQAERLDSRDISIGMDLSTEATTVHLLNARQALTAIAGEAYPAFAALLTAAYQTLAPTESIAVPAVQRAVRRSLGLRTLFRRAAGIALGIALVYLAWMIYRIYPYVRF